MFAERAPVPHHGGRGRRNRSPSPDYRLARNCGYRFSSSHRRLASGQHQGEIVPDEAHYQAECPKSRREASARGLSARSSAPVNGEAEASGATKKPGIAGSSSRPLLAKVDEITDLVSLDQTFPGGPHRLRQTCPMGRALHSSQTGQPSLAGRLRITAPPLKPPLRRRHIPAQPIPQSITPARPLGCPEFDVDRGSPRVAFSSSIASSCACWGPSRLPSNESQPQHELHSSECVG